MSISSVPDNQDASEPAAQVATTIPQVPAASTGTTAGYSAPVADAPAAVTSTTVPVAVIDTPVPEIPAATPAMTAPADPTLAPEVPDAPVAVVDPAAPVVPTSIAPASEPVIVNQRFFHFTEISVVLPVSSERLVQALAGPDGVGDPKKHFFISADAAGASAAVNEWSTGMSVLTVFGYMDENGTLKQPIILGKELGMNSVTIIHVTGSVVHNIDQNGTLVGKPMQRAFDTFVPQQPQQQAAQQQ